MIERAWRIVKAKHAASAFSGEGARLAGGRWNSPGVAVVYASQSASLAMLELLVHLQSHDLLKRYVLFELRFDASLVTPVDIKSLPRAWRQSPPHQAIQRIGDAWAAAKASAVLKVPSVLVPSECNFLLNPAHKDFRRIRIGERRPVRLDRRLIKSIDN